MTATLSSHILDTHLGKPAEGISVVLKRIIDDGAIEVLAKGKTNADGRVTSDGWVCVNGDSQLSDLLTVGRYTLTFDTESYFSSQSLQGFYPQVVIDFLISDDTHYHVPLLLSAHGFSTYRGS